MKTSSAKAKGRKLQQWVRDKLIYHFEFDEDDIKSTSMGAGGEDVQMSPEARQYFRYSIECKNTERVNVWKSYEQAESNAKNGEPLLIIKRNGHKPLAVLDAEHLMVRECYANYLAESLNRGEEDDEYEFEFEIEGDDDEVV